MKKTILAVVALMLLIGSVAFGETFRQGEIRFNFNPTAIVSKTAAYTLTVSDSLCNVACSSTNITITLPTVESTRPGGKAYKIVKTDSSAYAVIVAAATGDTIAGETRRYIVAQNGYICLSTGSGNNWTVSYESPYAVEDHSAGTVTVPSVTSGGKTFTAQSTTVGWVLKK